MKYNLRIIVSLLCLLSSTSALFAVSAKKSQEIENGNYENPAWVGPGWYGEAWIDTEADFNDWYGDDHRDRHDRDDDWDRRHRDDRRDDYNHDYDHNRH